MNHHIRHKRKVQPLSKTVIGSLRGIKREIARKRMEFLLVSSSDTTSMNKIADYDDKNELVKIKKEENSSSDDDYDSMKGIQVLSFNKPEFGDSRCSNVVEIKLKLKPPYYDCNNNDSSPSLNIFFYLPRSNLGSTKTKSLDLKCIFSYCEPKKRKSSIGPSETMIMTPMKVDKYEKDCMDIRNKSMEHNRYHPKNQRSLMMEDKKETTKISSEVCSITILEIYESGCVLVGKNGAAGIGDIKYWIPPGNIIPPVFLRDQVVDSISISYGYREGEDVCYDLVSPSFENICGGISLCNSSHIARVVEEMCEEEDGKNILKMNKTAFGVCHEIFTIYGNVTLRRDKNHGGMVSFKGARDVRMIYKTIKETLGQSFMEDCMKFKNYDHHRNDKRPSDAEIESSKNDESFIYKKRKRKKHNNNNSGGWSTKKFLVGDGINREIVIRRTPFESSKIRLEESIYNGYDGFFGVHMAVVTACLGKRLTVYSGSTLETYLQIVLGTSNVTMISCIDDENNAIKIRIINWKSVIEKSNHINDLKKNHKNKNIIEKNTCVVGDNTISVTAKGSVIARFSWDVALAWDESVSEEVLSTCHHLCNVLRECC